MRRGPNWGDSPLQRRPGDFHFPVVGELPVFRKGLLVWGAEGRVRLAGDDSDGAAGRGKGGGGLRLVRGGKRAFRLVGLNLLVCKLEEEGIIAL